MHFQGLYSREQEVVTHLMVCLAAQITVWTKLVSEEMISAMSSC